MRHACDMHATCTHTMHATCQVGLEYESIASPAPDARLLSALTAQQEAEGALAAKTAEAELLAEQLQATILKLKTDEESRRVCACYDMCMVCAR